MIHILVHDVTEKTKTILSLIVAMFIVPSYHCLKLKSISYSQQKWPRLYLVQSPQNVITDLSLLNLIPTLDILNRLADPNQCPLFPLVATLECPIFSPY